MITVMRHELNMQDRSFSTYLFGFFLLETVGIAAMIYNINNKLANFEYCLSTISLVFVLIIPIITMKSIAEERKLRTDQLLYSLPLSMWDIVLGKFFATLVNFMLPMVFVAIYPILFKRYGNVGREPRLWFFRDKIGCEIDVLVERDGAFEPIEIKKTASPGQSDVRAFSKVAKLGVPLGKGCILCLAERALPLAQDIMIIPIGAL